eukprot:TRINITY_DN8783_c0_g1_i2.p1 TRINITY_DN8783_c0_g1~~TRINITY_DN8783_c0_g1_i2.p1  ORF type:complete len:887 (+),score=275.81 TRINITY_DN8783_c0_g1_i2:48-2663(+)
MAAAAAWTTPRGARAGHAAAEEPECVMLVVAPPPPILKVEWGLEDALRALLGLEPWEPPQRPRPQTVDAPAAAAREATPPAEPRPLTSGRRRSGVDLAALRKRAMDHVASHAKRMAVAKAKASSQSRRVLLRPRRRAPAVRAAADAESDSESESESESESSSGSSDSGYETEESTESGAERPARRRRPSRPARRVSTKASIRKRLEEARARYLLRMSKTRAQRATVVTVKRAARKRRVARRAPPAAAAAAKGATRDYDRRRQIISAINQLSKACRTGDLQKAKDAYHRLSHRVDCTSLRFGRQHRTLLHWIALKGNFAGPDAVPFLCEFITADSLRKADRSGGTPLHLAAERGRFNMIPMVCALGQLRELYDDYRSIEKVKRREKFLERAVGRVVAEISDGARVVCLWQLRLCRGADRGARWLPPDLTDLLCEFIPPVAVPSTDHGFPAAHDCRFARFVQRFAMQFRGPCQSREDQCVLAVAAALRRRRPVPLWLSITDAKGHTPLHAAAANKAFSSLESRSLCTVCNKGDVAVRPHAAPCDDAATNPNPCGCPPSSLVCGSCGASFCKACAPRTQRPCDSLASLAGKGGRAWKVIRRYESHLGSSSKDSQAHHMTVREARRLCLEARRPAFNMHRGSLFGNVELCRGTVRLCMAHKKENKMCSIHVHCWPSKMAERHGRTPVHVAIDASNFTTASCLLQAGSQLTAACLASLRRLKENGCADAAVAELMQLARPSDASKPQPARRRATLPSSGGAGHTAASGGRRTSWPAAAAAPRASLSITFRSSAAPAAEDRRPQTAAACPAPPADPCPADVAVGPAWAAAGLRRRASGGLLLQGRTFSFQCSDAAGGARECWAATKDTFGGRRVLAP